MMVLVMTAAQTSAEEVTLKGGIVAVVAVTRMMSETSLILMAIHEVMV